MAGTGDGRARGAAPVNERASLPFELLACLKKKLPALCPLMSHSGLAVPRGTSGEREDRLDSAWRAE